MLDLQQPRYTSVPLSDTRIALDAIFDAGVRAGFPPRLAFNFAMLMVVNGGSVQQAVEAFRRIEKGRWVQ